MNRRLAVVSCAAFAFAAAATGGGRGRRCSCVGGGVALVADAFRPPSAPSGASSAVARSRASLSSRPSRPGSSATPAAERGRVRTLRMAREAADSGGDDASARAGAWDELASSLIAPPPPDAGPYQLREYASAVTLVRVCAPALLAAVTASACYTPLAYLLASVIDDSGVFFVVANDSSQYIQNILTTCGLTFSILVGQTYYFMYQQQEAIFVALFEEVAVAKSLLEQVSLVSQGRSGMYAQILESVERYVDDDLRRLQADPAVLLSARPEDDPLETVMYLTSVGEPSVVYDTVKSLRQARATRLGALQRKLPPLQMVLLWTLAFIVLATFPLLGGGVQTLGGPAILRVQSVYISFIVFGIVAVLGIIEELRKPAGGAYNVDSVLEVMVRGLEDELHGRLEGRYSPRLSAAPTVDPDPAAFWGGEGDGGEIDAKVAAAAAAMGWGVDRPSTAAAGGGVGAEAESFGPDDGRFGDEAGAGVDAGDEEGEAKESSRRRGFFGRFRRRD